MAQDAIATEQKRVSADDDGGEPNGKRAEMIERHEAEGDQRGEQQQLVGDRIEQRPERAPLVPMPGQVTVERVGNGGEKKDRNGRVAPAFVGMAARAGIVVGDHEHDENRH